MPSSLPSSIGTRIVVIGNTGSGKSTLAARLSRVLDASYVELDAIHWEPNWHGLSEHDPEKFARLVTEAIAGDRWVVAGNYSVVSEAVIWPRAETIVWLDMPLPLVLVRVIRRAWKRARTRELLWGTNYEPFWPHFRVWDKTSLIHWAFRSHGRRRRLMPATMADPRWAHLRFIRLRSTREVEAFMRSIEVQAADRSAR